MSGQQLQQFGIRRRVVWILHIDWVNKPATEHQRPQPIRNVPIERFVGTVRGELGQLRAVAEFRHRLHIVARRHDIFVARQEERLIDHHAIWDTCNRAARRMHEHGLERHLRPSPFGLERRLLVAVLAHDRNRWLQESKQTLIV